MRRFDKFSTSDNNLFELLSDYKNKNYEIIIEIIEEINYRNLKIDEVQKKEIFEYFKNVHNISIEDKLSQPTQKTSITDTIVNKFDDKVNILVEDKFDNDLIPTTKKIGIIGSIIAGFLIFFEEGGGIINGILYCIIGIMSTLGLSILLEGMSTIIRLLRKIASK
jgi:hypothetical protein